MEKLKNLYAKDIEREIQGVIKVDDESYISQELDEYVVTDELLKHFNSFFDAIYWAVVTLTTVGYGDIYPISDIGRFVSMLSSFMGIAIVALPTGIITAGYMNELDKNK